MAETKDGGPDLVIADATSQTIHDALNYLGVWNDKAEAVRLLKLARTSVEEISHRLRQSLGERADQPFCPEICIKAGCPAGGTVLDPFGGSGTTGLVADRLQRNAILIDLNPDNKPMAERRIAGDRGPLLDAMESAPQESQGHE